MANTPQVRFSDTLPADEISKELLPVVKALGVQKNCEELATEGWTILENAVTTIGLRAIHPSLEMLQNTHENAVTTLVAYKTRTRTR